MIIVLLQIRKQRLLKGLTQEELSRRSKISKSIIIGLENGKITVTTTKTFVRIAEALECSISKFFL
ncbi:helix-turn-helix domain-containing protein [Phascolarctobacterium succinatutens]|uniref:helix-turn-helix domain-containing protein n=1 Tax=Phascolarctobacterium succinatutens TaxID=626940 RepID=UPI0034C5B4B3